MFIEHRHTKQHSVILNGQPAQSEEKSQEGVSRKSSAPRVAAKTEELTAAASPDPQITCHSPHTVRKNRHQSGSMYILEGYAGHPV